MSQESWKPFAILMFVNYTAMHSQDTSFDAVIIYLFIA